LRRKELRRVMPMLISREMATKEGLKKLRDDVERLREGPVLWLEEFK
jgi:hypothetical protein